MPELTTWWWVRHGPTHEKAFVGWRDVPADLSDHAQVARVAEYLPPDALVISSDLSRALRTADAIAGRRRRLPHAGELREFDFGEWDGLGFDAVAARDPDLSRRYWEKPGDVRAPGGESWNDVAGRVEACVDGLTAAHAGTHLVAVAHIGVIMTQIARAVGGTPTKALGHKIDNFSITRLTFDGAWRVGEINHLP